MFHCTIFAGTEAQMPADGFSAFTFFGVAELKRPTLAQRAMTKERTPPRRRRWWDSLSGRHQNSIVTVFGATELTKPTLMEEYSALRGLLTTGAIGKEELTRRLRTLHERDADTDLSTLTLFGIFEDSTPGRAKQVKALASGAKAGLIPEEHRRRLDEVADAPRSTGIQVLGDLVTEMA
jgi:hypothetical protein